MTAEGKLQSAIIKWLKKEGAYVIKVRAVPGVPVGCPDIIFLYEGAWGVIEVKASRTAKFQSGQKATLERLGAWSPFCFVCHPDNWLEVQKELKTLFF